MPERDRVNRTVGAGLPLSATVRVSNNSCNSCNNNNNNNSGNSKNNGLCKKMNGRYASTCVQPTSSWHSAKEIIRAKGILGLWSGFGLHLCKWESNQRRGLKINPEFCWEFSARYCGHGRLFWGVRNNKVLVDKRGTARWTHDPISCRRYLRHPLLVSRVPDRSSEIAFAKGCPCTLSALSGCSYMYPWYLQDQRIHWILSRCDGDSDACIPVSFIG